MDETKMVQNAPLISALDGRDDEWQAWYGRAPHPTVYAGIVSDENSTNDITPTPWKDEDTHSMV